MQSPFQKMTWIGCVCGGGQGGDEIYEFIFNLLYLNVLQTFPNFQ